MLTKAIEVAAAFELLAEVEGGQDLGPTQILKLLYYGQALSLTEKGRPLFDGKFEALPHGPVEPTVWQFIRDRGGGFRTGWREHLVSMRVQLPDETWEIVRDVFKVFGGLTPIQLSNAARAELPCLEARDGKRWDGRSDQMIDECAIRDFYAEVLDDGMDVMQELLIAPEPDAPAWALPYRLGVNIKRLVGHPFLNDAFSRDLRRKVGLAEFPDDWRGFDFSPLPLTAEELGSHQRRNAISARDLPARSSRVGPGDFAPPGYLRAPRHPLLRPARGRRHGRARSGECPRGAGVPRIRPAAGG